MSRFSEGDFFYNDDEYESESYEDEYAPDHAIFSGVPTVVFDRWKQTEVDLAEHRVNCTILKQVTKYLEGTFFWRFRSLRSKAKLIQKTYSAFSDMVKDV